MIKREINIDGYAVVTEVVEEIVEIAPPPLHDQTSLEIAANRECGLSAEETMAASQELYEAGLISYPRTSSHNITPDMAPSVSALLANGGEGDSGSGGSPGGGGNDSGGGGSSGGGGNGSRSGGSPGGGENDFGSGGNHGEGGNDSGSGGLPNGGNNDSGNGGTPGAGGYGKGHTAPPYGNVIRDGSQLEDGKLKPNCTYQTGEYEYIYKTDSEGRITNWNTDNLQFTKRKDPLTGKVKNRLPHDSNTPGKEKGDHAGHLAGDRFGGSPKIDNLVSQHASVNWSEYKKIENEWDKALENGKTVKTNVEIRYEGNSLRPSEFIVTYRIDGEGFRKTILNSGGKNG